MKYIPFISRGSHVNVLKRANINNVCVGSLLWDDPEFRDSVSSQSWDTVLIHRGIRRGDEPYATLNSLNYCIEIAECLTSKHTYIIYQPDFDEPTVNHIGDNYELAFLLHEDLLSYDEMKRVAKEWRSSRVTYFISARSSAAGLAEYLDLGKYNTVMASLTSSSIFDLIDLRNGGIPYMVSEMMTYNPLTMNLISLLHNDEITPSDIRGLIEIRHICEKGFSGGD